MVRDIKFRGKRVDCDEWITGCYAEGDSTGEMKTFIIRDDFCFEVHPESIGQFICGTDKYDIYEADILQTIFDDGLRLSKFIVLWSQTNFSFCFTRIFDGDIFPIKSTSLSNKCVTGNVFDGGIEND